MKKAIRTVGKGESAFTLIELLVVIAIIALLLSIMVPSMRKAKEIARKVVCQSNTRQLGVAYGLYTDENDGFFPPSCQDPYVTPAGSGTWFLSLRPYYHNLEVLICPATTPAPEPRPSGWFNNRWQWNIKWWPSVFPTLLDDPEIGRIKGSYGENWWVTSSKSEYGVYPDEYKYKRTASIKSPTSVPVLGDCGSFIVRPTEDAEPPLNDGDYSYAATDEMRRVCTNRHNSGGGELGFCRLFCAASSTETTLAGALASELAVS